MLLPPEDVELFFKLHHALMHYVNERLGVVPGITDPQQFAALPAETRLEVRDAFLGKVSLTEFPIDENPANLGDDEKRIVLAWRHLVLGQFYAFRQLKKYMAFLSASGPPVAYGVVAHSEPFEYHIGSHFPVMVDAVLLPLRDKIVCDGLLTSYCITFGGGVKRMLNNRYREAKQHQGIVTSLPAASVPPPTPKAKKKQRPKQRAPSGPSSVKPDLETIIGMIDDFCRDHLNDEYAQLCRKLAEKLARKRPSPLLRGRPRTWACGIIRTIGLVNFLSDRATQPYLKLTAIDEAFGVAQSTGQAKSIEIRKMLRIRHGDMNWTLPSQMENNSLIWMVEVDGFPMDIRRAPRVL